MSRSSRFPGVADDTWHLLVRALQAFLGLAVLRGAAVGSPDIQLNALVGLLVTLVPDLIERRWGVTVAPAFVAWVCVAATMHVGGMVFGLYGPPTRYDDLTHAVSGSFVGAVGVVVVRLWERRDPDLTVPGTYGVVVALGVVMAGGVVWELIEFAVGGGGQAVQTSLLDTMSDLLFNLGGGLVTIALGRSFLDGVAADLATDLTDGTDE